MKLEEMILKYAEFGVLGVVTLLLLTRGLSTLKELTISLAAISKSQEGLAQSQTILAETTAKLAEQIKQLDNRIDRIERELRDIRENLSKVILQQEHLTGLITSKSIKTPKKKGDDFQ